MTIFRINERWSNKHVAHNFWIVCNMFIGSAFIDPENCHGVWLKILSGPYPNRTYRFCPPQVEGRVGDAGFCDSTCLHQYIDWLQCIFSSSLWLNSSQSYQVFCWFLVIVFPGVEEALNYKHDQCLLRVGHRGTKENWVNPSQIF